MASTNGDKRRSSFQLTIRDGFVRSTLEVPLGRCLAVLAAFSSAVAAALKIFGG